VKYKDICYGNITLITSLYIGSYMKLCTNYSCKHKCSELPFFLHTTQIIPYKQHMTCNDERKKVLMVKNTKPEIEPFCY